MPAARMWLKHKDTVIKPVKLLDFNDLKCLNKPKMA